MDQLAQSERIERAVIAAILNECLIETASSRTAVVPSGDVVEALVSIMAGLVATSEEVATSRARRQFCDRLAKLLGRRIVAMQAHIEEHGAPFATRAVQVAS
ncbi:hypothetical protein [Sphingomonas oligophenolica]|uniref:Uncharacterized protein n=1 Tax=Sphingomonas oligophenolica TaxID=301154 RepID=A0A502CJS6_9SPHN|nr:hypothetical protein [Sphingomonas oligophenolica]TPG13178.1 hypothetical protein EAH84_07195 [Sphingomonas oligophenolica]